jgi:hypothetical protein
MPQREDRHATGKARPRQIGECVTAPQRQRRAQLIVGAGNVTVGQRTTRVRDPGLEPLRVHLIQRSRR